ncbi:MAG: DMT family transporter [Clostridia bacterium]|nr:DMT family transporter [Clostridia bacterium]
MNKYKNLIGGGILLLAAIIWGFAFVAQSEGMEKVGAFTFQATRMLLAALVLLPTSLVFDKIREKNSGKRRAFMDKKTLFAGMVCGVFLFGAASLQQIGIMYTSVGHAGFLTALYLLLVPVLGLFMGKKVGARIWFCIALALAGLYLLFMTGEGFSVSLGDVLVMLCALVFAFHIIAVDKLAGELDGVKVSLVQMAFAGLVSLVCALIFEETNVSDIAASWLPISYAGVLSCGVAYTLQIVGQKYAEPTVASIVMSLESVFAVLGGMIFLFDIPSLTEFAGCALMFAATIISQLPERK